MSSGTGGIQTVERTATLLTLLRARTGGLGVASLAEAMGLPKATVHGLLRTLCDVGLVEQEHRCGRYRLGPATLHIGSGYLDENPLCARSVRWADALAARSGESVCVGMLHQEQVLVVYHGVGASEAFGRSAVGSLWPAHATALGKALLAVDPLARGELRGRALQAFTTATLTDPQRLGAELAQVLAQGWAAEDGELITDQASVAVPIVDGRGVTAGAIAIIGQRDRVLEGGLPAGGLLGELQNARDAIAWDLGARAW